jgi:hypothetical protein
VNFKIVALLRKYLTTCQLFYSITTFPSNNFSLPNLTLPVMRYTKCFSGVLKRQGVPNLNVEQYARLMNIVWLVSAKCFTTC